MSNATYGTFDAKAKLSEILDLVSQGEEVTITRHGKAIAQITPMKQTVKRSLGFAKGKVGFLEGWDKPLTSGDLLGE